MLLCGTVFVNDLSMRFQNILLSEIVSGAGDSVDNEIKAYCS